jgi:hypothetical protein
MDESFRRRAILSSALAFFVIFIMTFSAFAGAVEIGSITNDTPAVISVPDEMGVIDDGGLGQITGPDSSEQENIGESFADDLDLSEQESLADKILGDAEEPGLEGSSENQILINNQDFNGYKHFLDQAVVDYVKKNNPVVAKIGDGGQDSSYSTNLYDTVNAYLNKEKEGYATITEELSAQGFTPDREEVSKRTADTKVFRNGDGTFTAILNQKPIHYQDENGDWQDIDLTLRTMPDGSYGVVENTLKSFFAIDSSVSTIDIDGDSWFRWTPYEQRYIDEYGISHKLSSAQGAVGKVNDNTIQYENTFTDTDEEYFVQGDHVKHNMILRTFPASAEKGAYLSYVGKVELAEGLALYIANNKIVGNTETNGAIEVRNANNEMMYFLEAPFSFEYDDMTEAAFGSYRIEFVGDDIYLSLLTPIEWLTDPGRVYPVVIDPTISVDISVNKCGYSYLYYRSYEYHNGVGNRYYYSYYLYYPGYSYYNELYYTYIGAYGYSSRYSTYYYNRTYTRRAYFEWDTSAIPDANTVKQIDFHGKQFRTYNFPSSPTYKNTVTIRNLTLDPKDFPYYSSTAKKKQFFEGLASGPIYNSSVNFGLGYDINVDVYALGGTAVSDMQGQLPNTNRFRLAMHRSEEFPLAKPGYGYFYTYRYSYNADNAQLRVIYDPCPQAPDVDTGGPYSIPEGTNGVYLDASASVVCGTSATYKWDIGADGTWDITATSPKALWNKVFPDDWSTKIKLQIKDLTYGYKAEATTTFDVYNVHPVIVTPSTPITGNEGSTIVLPRIEFTDPGADTWKYFYDIDGDNNIDFSGNTTTISGKHYVPSVKWYFCDDADYVNLTIEDDDGGYSDDLEAEVLTAEYSGYIQKYTRPSSSYAYYYKYMRYSSYTYMYVRYTSSMTSYDYEYRGLAKFDARNVPTTFKPTKVTMRTYVYRVYGAGKVGVNDLSREPYYGSSSLVWTDAGSSNILKSGNYVDITSTGYKYIEIDPQKFINERAKHTSWFGVGLDRYDITDTDFNIYFRGGSYTTLTVSDGTKSYTLSSASGSNRYGAHGYAYKRTRPARDEVWRTDTSTYNYVRDYLDSYNGRLEQRTFIKFGEPTAAPSLIVGGDLRVYLQYMYNYYGPIKVGINDISGDPETATDLALYNDMTSSNIREGGGEWNPTSYNRFYTIPLTDSDVLAKYGTNGDWYAVGMKMNSATSYNYLYTRSHRYSTASYRPQLLVDYRVPFMLPVDVKNLDPVLDTSKMVISPSVVKEGDDVAVSGITYTDGSPCDTHQYRVVVPLGPGKLPMVVQDWQAVSGGKIDFKFKAPDDDPEDADGDITKDKVKIQIEVKDDDYEPNFHYAAVQLELMHYEYYMYSWYKDWGVYQNLQPWNEDTVTWTNYPRSYSKSTPEDTVKAHGDHVYTPGYSRHIDVWNVTSIVKKWTAGTVKNYGLRLQPVTAGRDPNYIYSNDYSTSSYRPLLRIIPKEVTQPEVTYQPARYDGKDARLRDSPYNNNNYGNDYYLALTYDSTTSSNRYESNGLIEFDMDEVPPETDENGVGRATFDITINNVPPVLDTSGMKIISPDGTEVSTVKEGEEFYLSNITFTDPALLYETEVFEYRVDYGNGTPTPWSTITVGLPGDSVVVPNNRESSDGSSNNYIPWWPGQYQRYQQWYDASQFTGSGAIQKISFRPDDYYSYRQWTTSYTGVQVYLSHLSSSTMSTTYANNYGSQRTLVFSGSFNWNHPANDKEWLDIPFTRNFNYNGVSNVVFEISYTGGSYSGNYPILDYDSSVYLKRLYARNPTDATGYLTNNGGLVTKFDLAPPSDLFGIIPDISYRYPDDHPKTGTASDLMQIKLEIRDDDGGTDSGAAKITVENVEPSIEPGAIKVNGAPVEPNILLVFDAYAGYNPIDWMTALKSLGQRPVVKSRTGMTVTEMNKYDMVIWMMGGEQVRYLSTTERNTITNYISGGGKLILQSTYWYNYYTWRTAFYGQFGLYSSLSTYYMGTSGSAVINGTGGAIGGIDEYTLKGSHSEISGYYYYISRFRTITGGIAEFMHKPYYYYTYRYVMVHRDNPSSGSIAMAMGFDINQMDDAADQKDMMEDILTYFGIVPRLQVEVNEGDEVQLENFDIRDPAEGAPTETFQYYVDWGDGEKGALTNVTDAIAPVQVGNYVVVPASFKDTAGGVGLRPPLEAAWYSSGQRFQQLYPSSEMGGKAREIMGLKLRNWVGTTTPWTNTYNNFKMYINHISSSTLSSTFASNYGTDRTLVFSRTTYTISHPGTWTWINLGMDTKFKYDGSSNLVLEISWTSGSGSAYAGVVDYGYLTGMHAKIGLGSNPTSASYTQTNAGVVTNFTFTPLSTGPTPSAPYTHIYRDDPSWPGDVYSATLHVYDDDLGHGELPFYVKVNNVKPTMDPKYVMPVVTGQESGSPSVLLPQVPFDDPATQYDITNPNEKWIYWWDMDNNGIMNNAPDVVGSVPQSLVNEINTHSYGKTPQVKAMVNDDTVREPIACYIFDDDMLLNPSASPDGTTGSLTVTNVAPVASLDAYLAMEVRLRMTGRQYNDLKVIITQTHPNDPNINIVDTITMERMPGQPKNNPTIAGQPFTPFTIKVIPGASLELKVIYDAYPDINDPLHPQDHLIGSNRVNIFLDFPMEPDYDPRDADQSVVGHHWNKEFWFKANEMPYEEHTFDITDLIRDKQVALIGKSYDDSSDDNSFHYKLLSGSFSFSHTDITHYNDNSPPQVGGAYKDVMPSPWTGTAPITYTDVQTFTYTAGFSVQLVTKDDDGGSSTVVTYTLPAPP